MQKAEIRRRKVEGEENCWRFCFPYARNERRVLANLFFPFTDICPFLLKIRYKKRMNVWNVCCFEKIDVHLRTL